MYEIMPDHGFPSNRIFTPQISAGALFGNFVLFAIGAPTFLSALAHPLNRSNRLPIRVVVWHNLTP
jgi:hypothetical protein